MNEQKKNQIDPLKLSSISLVIERLVQLNSELADQPSSTRYSLVVEQLTEAFSQTEERYQLLKDRYELLKRSNAALGDELIWLRDQLDDLSS